MGIPNWSVHPDCVSGLQIFSFYSQTQIYNYIYQMSKLNELKEFMTKQQTRNDPFWRSILQSDTRNIFPKHELAKIDITKNKMSKMRLIMEQLPNFFSLQIYAKNIEQVLKTQLDNDLKKQLDQLSLDLEQCKSSNTPSDYQFQVLQCKEKLEYFCRELAKNKIKPELKEIMQKSPKWKSYLENYTKQASKLDPILNEKEKCDLAYVIGLQKIDDCLLTGTSGKIIEERIKQKVFMDRLKEILLCQSEDFNLEIANDPWKEEWEQVIKKLKEPTCYV